MSIVVNQMNIEELDVEWTQLIMTARSMGLSTDDIRTFLQNPSALINYEYANEIESNRH
ncbi:anti-repressor SinI family protein [Paenibacillus rigui]|uniref:Sin domain-containing protein n=1 Tax=Paenibacillus rigui TaxID=554312 RepID=A0A229UP53_9BACL|nr:anti-repressor SinI family protein [Paenibacillus rigui]OXM85236.1 hypothetical protein CF651_16705 [Paenibacillus rigui]